MSIIGASESQVRYTPQARRGYDYCRQIREIINNTRAVGIEPMAVWVNGDAANAMRALWFQVCGENWDGVIPKWIAGVPCREGMTGGRDFVLQYTDNQASHDAREQSAFKVVDDPHGGLH